MMYSKINSLFLFLLLPTYFFAQTYIPGNTYLDNNGYVEYLAGNTPIIISAPHGGYLEPSSISDRNCNGCTYIRDAYTQELARETQTAFFNATGCYPHVVINLLHRKKFDANRDIGDAADGDPTVEQSWYAYHDFLDSAKATVLRDYGSGLFLDFHGHGHTIQRIELGYTLSKSDLQLPDSTLNMITYIQKSSIENLIYNNLNNHTHAELLRGNSSFGTMLDLRGYPAVPSTSDPAPLGNQSYFTGGYNTIRHGSDNGGLIDGIQVECNQNIRFDEATRQEFADSMTQAIIEYIDVHYQDQFQERACGLLLNTKPISTLAPIKVYPNPTNQQFQIESQYSTLDILIYDSLGRNIYTLNWNGSPLNIEYLPQGIYYLQFKQEDTVVGNNILAVN